MSQPYPVVLLGDNLVIRAATPSYLRMTGRDEEELLSVSILEAFPENPDAPEAQSTKALVNCVEHVLRTGRQQHLSPVRYDIPDSRRPGEFLEKRWMMVHSPVRDGDDVVGVMCRVEDVTLADEQMLTVLRSYRDLLEAGDLRSVAARRRVEAANQVLAMAESYANLVKEVSGLRRALATRPTIDQAKGIIMADRRCTPDEAFEVLKKLSMDTNVRLADVAAAIVYQTQGD